MHIKSLIAFIGFLVSLSSAANAVVILELRVDFVQSGPVNVGSTVDWNLFASVSTSDSTNFGTSSLQVDLTESLGEVLSTATIGAPFADYDDSRGGFTAGGAGTLRGISVTQFTNSLATTELIDPVNGGSLAEVLFASGSYTVNTIGTHTLTPSQGQPMRHFTGASQALGDSTTYDTVNFTSDSITVTAVPEPSSIAFFGVVGGILMVRRRRK